MLDYSSLKEKYTYSHEAFSSLMAVGEHTRALSLAMNLRQHIFREQVDSTIARQYLFDFYFKKLDRGYKCQYQSYDFEVVDYKMSEFCSTRQLFRGPLPSPSQILHGNYITIMGAAQLFGRFHKTIFTDMVAEYKTSLSFMNLSLGGAGPEYYLYDKFIKAANSGSACVLQVLSARSVGTTKYPGMRMTSLKGTSDQPKDRLEIYSELYKTEPEDAISEVKACQSAYMDLMVELISKINVPICLVWISSRLPDEWSLQSLYSSSNEPDFGLFPQLVDRHIWEDLKKLVSSAVVIRDEPLPIKSFKSEITNEPCPIFSWTGDGTVMWSEAYYPSFGVHQTISEHILRWLDAIGL